MPDTETQKPTTHAGRHWSATRARTHLLIARRALDLALEDLDTAGDEIATASALRRAARAARAVAEVAESWEGLARWEVAERLFQSEVT